MTTRQILGDHLRFLREKAGLTQDQAAKRAGLNLRTLPKLEAGQTNPNFKTLEKLAVVYACTLAEVFSPWGTKGQAPPIHVACKQLNFIHDKAPDQAKGIKTMIDAVYKKLLRMK